MESFRLGSAFGIPIRVHWTFLLLFVLLASSFGVLGLLLLFTSVLLHELGHSLVARHYGIEVLDITFWPLGGMARMRNMPEVPNTEAWIALAGPGMNILLALIGSCLLLMLLALGTDVGWQALVWFVGMNLMLGFSNLIPAFPMDGGRVLRALMARRSGWLMATEKAVAIGRWVAMGMVVLSLVFGFTAPGLTCMLLVVAMFLWLAGGRELMAVRVRHGLSPFGTPLAGAGAGAGGGETTWEPVPEDLPPQDKSEADPGQARRPDVWEREEERSHGFDDATVRKLERFRGPLRRQDDD